MKKTKMKAVMGIAVAMAMAVSSLTACGGGTKETKAATEAAAETTAKTEEETKAASEAKIDLPDMDTPDEWVSRFEDVSPTAVEDFNVTDDQVAKIKDAGLTAALCMHTSGESFSAAVISGAEKACEELGIEIVATTDAQWDSDELSKNIDSVMAKNPDIIVLCQIDVEAMTDQIKEYAAQGVSFAFFDNINSHLDADDYASLVTTDTYGAGVEAAKILAQELNGKGQIAMFTWATPNLGNLARSQGFRDYIETNFPDIEIATEEFYTDASDCASLADAVFAKYPNIDGAFGQWDVPAEGVISSAQGNGLTDDFVVTCVDLGYNVARLMAEDGMVKGIGAQQPYKDGYYSIYAGALDAVGEEVPKMILIDPVSVTKDNLEEAWPIIYDVDLPDDIQSLLK